MEVTNEPKITFVSAELISTQLTNTALTALATANVVFYDATVDEKLIALAPEESVKVFLGKRGGNAGYTQQEINKLSVQYAFYYGHVVRLKGNRAHSAVSHHEEIDYAHAHGVTASVVAGIAAN